MNKQDTIRRLRDFSIALEGLNLDWILKIKKLGANSLEDQKPLLLNLFNRLKLIIENADNISLSTLVTFDGFYSRLLEFLSEKSNLSDRKFMDVRNEFLDDIIRIKDDADGLWEKTAGIIKNKYDELALEEQIKNIDLVKEFLEKRSYEQVTQIETLRNNLETQFEEFKERYSPLNTNLELENQRDLYEKEAKENASRAIKWRNGIIGSGIVLFFIVIYFICTSKDDLSNLCVCTFVNFNQVCQNCGQEVLWFFLIKMILLKALLISLNIYILKFCIKNYNAAMHNQTVNKQRQNSFGAALHFYNNIVSERKDEILVLAANSIFAHQKTGYIEKGSEPDNPVILEKIIEKAEKIVDKKVI